MAAYMMLNTFVDLKPGDWIAQNAANSSVNIRSIHLMPTRSELQIGGESGGPVGQGSWNPHHQPGSPKVSTRKVVERGCG